MTSTDETCPLMSSSSMTTYGSFASILPPTPDLFVLAREQWKMAKAQATARAASSRQPQEWGRNDSSNNKQRVTRIRTIRINCKKSGWESKQFQGNTKHSKNFFPTRSNHIGHPMIVKQQHEMFCTIKVHILLFCSCCSCHCCFCLGGWQEGFGNFLIQDIQYRRRM